MWISWSRRWTRRCARMRNPGTNTEKKTGKKKRKTPGRGAGQSMSTRDAVLPDAEQIHDLIAAYSGDGTLLPRTLAEICENVRDFIVLEEAGHVIGCGALHLYGPHLAEVRSITVDKNYQKRGGGELLVQSLMSEAREHEVSCICLFTRTPEFFSRLGFGVAQREDLPDKINKDCCVCPRYHCCDDDAMIKDVLPRFAILPELANFLVKLQI